MDTEHRPLSPRRALIVETLEGVVRRLRAGDESTWGHVVPNPGAYGGLSLEDVLSTIVLDTEIEGEELCFRWRAFKILEEAARERGVPVLDALRRLIEYAVNWIAHDGAGFRVWAEGCLACFGLFERCGSAGGSNLLGSPGTISVHVDDQDEWWGAIHQATDEKVEPGDVLAFLVQDEVRLQAALGPVTVAAA
jgi:hypothetical protein